MKFSRVILESDGATPPAFTFGARLAVVSAPSTATERLLSAFRDFFLGTRHACQIFATIDETEFEITPDMYPLLGRRLGGAFGVIDLALPPAIASDSIDIRDVQCVVARAALETLGAIRPTLDLERIDHAVVAIDRYRDPLANDAHAAYLRRTGLLQLFPRRSGREGLDPDDPVVRRLAEFDRVLIERRRQLVSTGAPCSDDLIHATGTLRELASTTVDGIPAGTAASMTDETIERTVARWVQQQHDRQIAPILTDVGRRYAQGIDVLGSIPLVLDLRHVTGPPPGGEALRHLTHDHDGDVQVIALGCNDEQRAWIEAATNSTSTT